MRLGPWRSLRRSLRAKCFSDAAAQANMPPACLQRRPQRLRHEERTLWLHPFFRRLRAAELCEAFPQPKIPLLFNKLRSIREGPF